VPYSPPLASCPTDRPACIAGLFKALFSVTLIVVATTQLAACSKFKNKSKAAAAASASAAAAASLSAERAQAAAVAAAAAASASAAAAAASASAAAAAAANAAAIERAKQLVADLKWMSAHNVTQNPAKAGEGDASTKCGTAASSRKGLGPTSDPELKKLVDEAMSLCAFEIPIATAAEALDQLRFSPSQASRRLMCDVAARELDRARAVKTNARLRSVDARRREACLR
jgi:hypothetical protein